MENEPQDAYLPGSEDTLQPFDAREQTGRGGMIKLVGLGLFILLMAIVIMKLFASGTRDRNQTPRILADNTPYKEVPLDRGGQQTPNQDKEIYQVLKGTSTETAVKTVPVVEEPLPKPKPLSTANVIIKEPATTKTIVNTQPKPVITQPKTISGNYVVQVASLRSQAEAELMWAKLKRKMGSTLTPTHYADIKRVDLGSRGIYYRLRINGLTDKISAKQLCKKLKAAKQDCIVTQK